MEPKIELRVAELLASRLCHDLISPVGAVNSGIELMTEFGDDPDGESMALITSSARTASDKLLFFRIAYGNAGSGTNVPLADGLKLVAPVCINQRTEAVIDDASAGAMPGAGAVKLLLCLALMAGVFEPTTLMAAAMNSASAAGRAKRGIFRFEIILDPFATCGTSLPDR